MARVRSPRRAATLLGAAAAFTALMVAIPAQASTPPSQSTSVPSEAGRTRRVTWTGTVLPGVNPASDCEVGTSPQDHHRIRLSVPAGVYRRLSTTATFGITWEPSTGQVTANDLIVTVIGPDGEQIESSDGGSNAEAVQVRNPKPGTYDVIACGFANAAPQEYQGSLTIRTTPRGTAVPCTVSPPPRVDFADPIYIDRARAGGEPVSVVAQDGSIIVSAHAGTTHLYKDPTGLPGITDYALIYANQTLNWRSDDGGRSWAYIGLFGGNIGPHTVHSSGFSDPDLTMDAGGRIYNVEINLANVSVFSSNDDGQSFGRADAIAASGDRPWVTGKDEDEVFLTVSGGQVRRSTNGGLTFATVTNEAPIYGKLLNDPLNPDGLIAPFAGDETNPWGAAISPDRGRTWKTYPLTLGRSTQFFGTLAVDRKGWIYAAAAGGYEGAGDSKPDGQVTFSYFNRRTKKWADPVVIPTPKGDALWPWIVAGDDGRVGLVWYQSLAEAPERWYIYHGYTLNGHGTKVRCEGRSALAPPSFRVTNASERVIHAHPICLLGTACLAAPNPEDSDRRLGDFFTINFDSRGRMFIASGDTMLSNPLGGPKPVSNPIFIRQVGGPALLVRPDPTRPTRPVCAPPCLP